MEIPSKTFSTSSGVEDERISQLLLLSVQMEHPFHQQLSSKGRISRLHGNKIILCMHHK